MSQNIFLYLLSIVVSIVIAYIFYIRSTKRKLTPFIHYHSNILSHISPEIKKRLKLAFDGKKIQQLTEYQILIANNGFRAIRDFIRPLTIVFPATSEILDATIPFKYPKELIINFTIDKNNDKDCCTFEIPLLNKNDLFLMKFLINGQIKALEPEFYVTVDDLPPKLNPEWLSLERIKGKKWRENITEIIISLLMFSFSIAILFSIYDTWKINQFLLPSIEKLIQYIFVILLLVFFGAIGLLNSFFNFEELFRKKFKIPEEFTKFSVIKIEDDIEKIRRFEEIKSELRDLEKN